MKKIFLVGMIVAISLLAIKNLGKMDSLMSSSISQNGSIASELTYMQSKNIFNGVTLLWKETTKTTNSWETCNVLGRKVGDTAWKNYTAKNIKNQIPMNIAPQGVVIPDTNYPSTTDAPPTTEDENNKTRTQYIYLSGFYTGTYEFKISCTEGESSSVTISFDKDTYCRDYREKRLEIPCACTSDSGDQISPSNKIQSSFFLQSSAVSQEDDLFKKDIEKLQTGTKDILKLFQTYADCDDENALQKNYKQFKGLAQAEEDARKNNNPFALSVILAIKAADKEDKDMLKKGNLLIESANQLNIALLKYKENDIVKRYKGGMTDKVKEMELDGKMITAYCNPIYIPIVDDSREEVEKTAQIRQALLSRLKKLKAQISLLGTNRWQNV